MDICVNETRPTLQWCGIPIQEGDDLFASKMVGFIVIRVVEPFYLTR